jgi:hypothetical protein
MKKKTSKKYLYNLVIGDWSKDGHNQSEEVLISGNKSKKEVMDSYLKTCKKLAVQLHDNKGELCDYESRILSPEAADILLAAGCPLKDILEETESNSFYCAGPAAFVPLFFWFVKKSLPDFKYELVPKHEHLNGWWDKDYNFSLGYGLFNA